MKIDHLFIAAAAVALALAFAIPFGIAGLRVYLGFVIFFFLPSYLILRRCAFDEGERVFFAFFVGIGLFTTAVYFVGRIVPSFRISVFVTLVVLLALALSLERIRAATRRQLRKRSGKRSQQEERSAV